MLSKVKAKTAAEICGGLEFEAEESKALLTEEISPEDYLNKLIEAELYPDAVQFLAYALPPRESTGWLCLCARQVQKPDPPQAEKEKLAAAEGWVKDPQDEPRRIAFAAAEDSGPDTPAGCACMAAFFSGGSVAPPDAPEVELEQSPTPKLVAGGIRMCAVLEEPEKADEKYRRFLETGLRVGRG